MHGVLFETHIFKKNGKPCKISIKYLNYLAQYSNLFKNYCI